MRWDDPAIEQPLAILWDYMRLVHAPSQADAILALGSFDPQAAVVAAGLWRAGWARTIIMSGGIAHQGTLLQSGWDRSEAEVFADVAVAEGVPREAILLECEAQNTGQNFSLGKALAVRLGLKIERLLVAAKPYMTRRGYATGRIAWPEAELLMQCEEIDVRAYFARDPKPERTLRAMIGDFHRILVYPGLGFQIEQDVPEPVLSAARALVQAGFGDRLIAGHTL